VPGEAVVITVAPIPREDNGNTYGLVFASRFANHQLGKAGTWQGEAVNRLKLENPVDVREFLHLLRGRTPDGRGQLLTQPTEDRRLLGWRMTISTSPSLSALWALVDRRTRTEIEKLFLASVRGPLHSMEKSLNRWEWGPRSVSPLQPGALFAKFRAGATVDQRPHLHMTVFVFNLAFRQDGKVETFDAGEVRRQAVRMHALSEKILGFSLWNNLGISLQYLDMDKNSLGIPREPTLKFFSDPAFNIRKTPKPGDYSKAVASKDLFAAWQTEARKWNWGPKEARRYVEHAKHVRQVLLLDTRVRQRAFQAANAFNQARDAMKRLLSSRVQDRRSQPQQSDQKRMQISY